MASLSQQFAQSNKKIFNHIPAQCDNTHPVEIVIHLLKSDGDDDGDEPPRSGHTRSEYSEMKAILNNSVTFLNEINAATNDENGGAGQKTRNLTDILKRFVGATANGTNGASIAFGNPSSNGTLSGDNGSSSTTSRRASVPSSTNEPLARPLNHSDLFADSTTSVQVSIFLFSIPISKDLSRKIIFNYKNE